MLLFMPIILYDYSAQYFITFIVILLTKSHSNYLIVIDFTCMQYYLPKYCGGFKKGRVTQIACILAASLIFSGYYLVMTSLSCQICGKTPAKLMES